MDDSEGSTRQVRHDRNRAGILSAARRLVAERGVDGFSLRAVARQTGYAPGAVYTYFKSKEALLAAVGSDATAALATYLERVPIEGPARDRLVALSDAYLRFAADEPERYRAAFGRLTVPLPGWAEFARVAQPFTLIVETFADGVARGEFATGPGRGPDTMALGLWALLHGSVDLRAVMLRAYSAELVAPTMTAIATYLGGLR